MGRAVVYKNPTYPIDVDTWMSFENGYEWEYTSTHSVSTSNPSLSWRDEKLKA